MTAPKALDELSSGPAPRKKRKASKSPTSRTLEECRRRGWPACVVERFVRFPPPGHHLDAFGVIDAIAIQTVSIVETANAVRVTSGIVGIQACAGTDHAKRRAKILAEPRARQWVGAGGRLELWSWAKQGAAGKRKLWTLRVEVFTAESWGSTPATDLPADLVPDAIAVHQQRRPRIGAP